MIARSSARGSTRASRCGRARRSSWRSTLAAFTSSTPLRAKPPRPTERSGLRADPGFEAAALEQVEHESRERRRRESRPVDGDLPAGVDLDGRARLRRGGGVSAQERRKPEVDAVAVEDAREALADERLDAGGPHRLRDVLPGAPGAEVAADDEDRVTAELVAERRIEPFEEVARHLVDVRHVEIRAGIQHVGVDVVLPDHDRAAGDDHAGTASRISAGSTISPATAAAAATHAFARWTFASGDPIRPRKFRFVVVIADSPAARMPVPPPKQAPHVGVETIAPASTNTSRRPSAIASR